MKGRDLLPPESARDGDGGTIVKPREGVNRRPYEFPEICIMLLPCHKFCQ